MSFCYATTIPPKSSRRLHHIMARGIEDPNIFNDDRDRYDFIDRLGAIVEESGTNCFAWALIPNHFHLLLRTGSVSIVTVMRRFLTGRATRYNRRHRRSGHLFQNRYKSILCEEGSYFLGLVRYIHLNTALGAKLVQQALLAMPDQYNPDTQTSLNDKALEG